LKALPAPLVVWKVVLDPSFTYTPHLLSGWMSPSTFQALGKIKIKIEKIFYNRWWRGVG
jgi:hypothetical protein